MKKRILFAALALGAAAIPAQSSCPKEQAQTIPQSTVFGPAATCAGLSYSIGGLQITTATGCPLFVTITPDHEVAKPSKQETMVVANGVAPGKLIFFACRTTYLIFIPIGSSCEYLRDVNFGAFPRLTTAPCREEPQA
jgi:hypothetical protein